jgi:hypothetical protein
MRTHGFHPALSWLAIGLNLVICGPAAAPAPGRSDRRPIASTRGHRLASGFPLRIGARWGCS